MRITMCHLIAVMLLCPAAVRVAGDETDELVAALASKDVQVRAAAEEKLTAMGDKGRAVLVRAVNGKDLAARQAATLLLMRLPFDRPDDAQAVREVLRGYGQGDVAARTALLPKLAALHTRDRPEVAGVFLRLMREDPSDDVRWGIVSILNSSPQVADNANTPQRLDAGIDRAPNLALAGTAWEKRDLTRAVALWERCLELDAQNPTARPGIILIYYKLAVTYARQRRFDDAAEMHRRGYVRQPQAVINRAGGSTSHLMELFALHARHGPLKGFAYDVKEYPEAVTRAPLIYAVARAYERSGRRAMAQGLYASASKMITDHPMFRYRVATYLLGVGMDAHAEPLLEEVVASASVAPRPPRPAGATAPTTGPAASFGAAPPQMVVDARLQLAMIASRRGQDFVAAERLRTILENPLPAGVRLTRGRNPAALPDGGDAAGEPRVDATAELRALMHWRYLRAAKAKNNVNSIKAHAKEIAKLAPDDPDVIVDAVPVLREIGRGDDAKRLFETAYATRKAQLAERRDDPLRMNNLAWLCARCGEHLEEAKGLIDAALKADPDNPAYQDTAAEAYFQSGDVDRAIEFERRALESRPDDAFMREQLERFLKARESRK